MAMADWFGQSDFDIRHEWGRDGARRVAARGDVAVIVDVLRFSTTVVAAVANGWQIRPCASEQEVVESSLRGEIADGRNAAAALSPLDYRQQASVTPPPVVALQSLNGATCSRIQGAARVIAGALVNATAAGKYLEKRVMDGARVTVVSCGERWEESGADGPLRFAMEDYIGAGAIISAIRRGRKSPEALACEGAFLAVHDRLPEVLESCGSGIELANKGRIEDVKFAARLDSISVVPGLAGGIYVRWSGE
jgi:2-phosphosulfolactate phosphatase